MKKYCVGDYYEKKYCIDESTGEKFAEISGDFNPIHLDVNIAQKTRFKQKIVHGMLIGSYISGIIGNEFPGSGSIYLNQELEFIRPVYYNQEIIIRVEVVETEKERRRIKLMTKCFDIDNKVLVNGEAYIMLEE